MPQHHRGERRGRSPRRADGGNTRQGVRHWGDACSFHVLMADSECCPRWPHPSLPRFDVGGGVRCQLTCFPGGGARYVRHSDASPSTPGRSVTALLYLNPSWELVRHRRGGRALHQCKYKGRCPLSSSAQAQRGGSTPGRVHGVLRGPPGLSPSGNSVAQHRRASGHHACMGTAATSLYLSASLVPLNPVACLRRSTAASL